MTLNSGKKILRALYEAWRWGIAFIRWTAIVLFSVLFLVGLILRVPWKILLLLAVVPAVGFLVPRRTQKWVWIFLALLAAAVYLWIFFLPEWADSQWRTYQFDSKADPVPPPGEHNAATYYMEILDASEEAVFSYPYSFAEDQATYAGPWEPQRFRELSRWLDDRGPALEALIQTAGMPLCQFEEPIDYWSYQRQQLRVKLIKAWASVLIRAAHRDLAAGRPEAAMEKHLTILGMARHLFGQGTLLDQAVGYFLEEGGLRVLHVFILEYCKEETMLAEIESAASQMQSGWPVNWPLILQREKQLARNTAGMFYQVNPAGRTRISRDLGQGLHEALGHPAYRFFRAKELSRLLALGMWLGLPASPEGLGAMIDRRFDRYSKMVESGKDLETVDTWPVWLRGLNYRSVVDWYAKQQVSFYYPLQRKDRRHRALGRATRIFIELKRYKLRKGAWPQTLEEVLGPTLPVGQLVDPVSEMPFVYERTGESFRLYGIGVNKQDDGGLVNIKEGRDDQVYWPQPGWEDFSEENAENGAQSKSTGGAGRS